MNEQNKEDWKKYAIGTIKKVEKNTRLLANGTLKITVIASLDDEKKRIQLSGEESGMESNTGLTDIILALGFLGGDKRKGSGFTLERLDEPDDQGKCKFEFKIEDRKLAATIAEELRKNDVNFVGSNLSAKTRSRPKGES